MRSYLLIGTFLAVSLTVVAAQQSGSDSSSDTKHQSVTQGCLNNGSDGFTLSSGGTTYMLSGDTSQLAGMAGKEVKVTGNKGNASETSTGASGNSGLATSNPTAGTAPTIKITRISKVADQYSK
jgi:hypothetical protein